MNTNIKTRTQVKDTSKSSIDSVSRASLIAMGGVSALVGIWAIVAFASALFQTGPVEMFKGFITAMIGV